VANGKRRANWEKVLEERMADGRANTSAMVTDLNLDLRKQVSDLQSEVGKIKKEALRMYILLVAVAILGLLTAVLK